MQESTLFSPLLHVAVDRRGERVVRIEGPGERPGSADQEGELAEIGEVAGDLRFPADARSRSGSIGVEHAEDAVLELDGRSGLP
jgi:hypothetical protein